jgi:lysophospholipase L1-like esterase
MLRLKMQKTILCYGDSNTWGYVPQPLADLNITISRYSRDKRWTGRLQENLGDNYYVIEEGLNGRTTNLDYHIEPDRNGKRYLAPCLYTHAPIDLVIMALGGNDLKALFKREAEDIANGLSELIDVIQNSTYGSDMITPPNILIIPPPIPLPIIEELYDENGSALFKRAIEKSKKLIALYARLAAEKKCFSLEDGDDILASSVDGMHFDCNAHAKIAVKIAQKVKGIYRELY